MRLKLALFSLVTVVSLPVHAQGSATWHGEIDGVPAWVTVVSEDATITSADRESSPWWEWGDTSSDSYIFAFEEEQNEVFIVSFAPHPEGGSLARFYVSPGPDTPIPFRISRGELIVQSLPTFELRSHDGGWIAGGETNYDLSLRVDGLGEDHPLVREEIMPGGPDGTVDRSHRVGGENGIPLWETERIVNDARPEWGYIRFAAMQRMEEAPPFRVARPLIPTFPHLGIGNDRGSWLVSNPHPIYFRIDEHELLFNHFVGFQNGGNYYVSSIAFPPEVNFESPFAFYNFDSDTRAAHLVVRSASFPFGAPWGARPIGQTRTTFRYSWKTTHNLRWQYGLHVAGFHPFEETIEIGDSEFLSVSDEHLPNWVIDREWPLVTFVEAVNGYPGSEGMYFYSAQALDHWSWLSGEALEPTPLLASPYLAENDMLTRYSDVSLPPGFRGEYSSSYFSEPRLYFDAIDRRVHLLGAEGGVWNLGEGRILRTLNLDDDPYVDVWRRELVPEPSEDADVPEGLLQAVPGKIEAQIFTVGDYLAYYGNREFRLYRNPQSRNEVLLSPPTDRTSWLDFREETELAEEAEQNPHDLLSWLPTSVAPLVVLSDTQIGSLNTADGVVRFELAVSESGQRANHTELAVFDRLAPGRYHFIFDGSQDEWRRTMASEAAVAASISPSSASLYSPQRLEVRLENRGTGAWRGKVELEIGDQVRLLGEDVWLPEGEILVEELDWYPLVVGELPVSLRLQDHAIPLGALTVKAPKRAVGREAIELSLNDEVGVVPAIAGLLVFLITVGMFRVWRS